MTDPRRIIALMRASTGTNENCPIAPASRETTYVRALHLACLIVGGLAQLAEHLKAPEPSLRAWMEGREDPPQAVFLAAVEILLLHAGSTGRAS